MQALSDEDNMGIDFENFILQAPQIIREENVFYYTISDSDKKISYEIGNQQKIKFSNEENEKVERAILLHALKNGHIGILKDVNNIKYELIELKNAKDEAEVQAGSKKSSMNTSKVIMIICNSFKTL